MFETVQQRTRPRRIARFVAFGSLVFATTSEGGAQTILVTSPNGGEEWRVGQTRPITWQSQGTLNPYVDIQYSTDDADHWFYLTTTPNTGQYSWVVHPDAAADRVRIKVLGYQNQMVYLDISDNPLIILSSTPRRMELADLDGWLMSRPEHISTSHDTGRSVAQLSYPAGDAQAGPLNAVALRSCESSFHHGTYRARLKAAACEPFFASQTRSEGVVTGFFTYWQEEGDDNGNGLTDLSEIDFELLGQDPSSIYITIWTAESISQRVTRYINMRTGATYQADAGRDTYYSVGALPADSRISDFDCASNYYVYGFDWQADSIRFFIYRNDRMIQLWHVTDVARIPTNPAFLLFNVWHSNDWWAMADDHPTPLLPPATTATLSLDWVETPNPEVPHATTVISPNGGEDWLAGSSRTIRWTTAGEFSPYVDIQYTLDYGGTWRAAANGVFNNGTYTWAVPDTPSRRCRVKVLAYYGQCHALDVSDAVFAIGKAGDLNCDDAVDGKDITAFMLAAINPTEYWSGYPDCNVLRADLNDDGIIDDQDVRFFVGVLLRR